MMVRKGAHTTMVFVISTDNDVTYRPGSWVAPYGGARFSSHAELIEQTREWPLARLAEIWNGFAGVVPFDDLRPVKKFMDRPTAIGRIWRAVLRLTEHTALQDATLPDVAPAAPPRDNTTMPKAKAKGAKRAAEKAKPAPAPKAPSKPREGSKQQQVIDMLRRKNGATLAEIMKATDWQRHTVRGFVSGTLGKKLGLVVESAKSESGDRTYRIVD